MEGADGMNLFAPLIHVEAIDRETLNRCLVAWDHKMGPYTRPSYAIEAHHALFSHGEPVAVVAAGETVREVVGDTGIGRFEVVELARMCAARPGLCKPFLRLWRELIFPDIAKAHGRSWAISYQDETLHTGNLYTHDGWIRIGKGGGGGPDSRTGRPGRKLAVWGWPRNIADLVAERRSSKDAA